MTILDRLITWVAPQWGASRQRARFLARHFQAASFGRRTDGWSRRSTDANAAAAGAALSLLRSQARDLVRNNPWARRGLRRICSDAVGGGIRPRATGRGAELVMERWKRWGETTECDAAGRLTFYGLQRLAMRTIAESGEVLIRRRYRLPDDGLSIPMQLQILEPDFLDTGRDRVVLPTGGEIIQGVEFDPIGRRVAYWLFDKHPGGLGLLQSPISRRVPADGVLHVFDQERAGQVRGPSWFASVDVRLHDFGEFEDATLMKQKIAACMAAFVTDIESASGPLALSGTDSASGQLSDTFEPGAIISLTPGKSVQFANPPQSNDHTSYCATSLRGIAAGLGTTYSGISGDYSQANYSSERAAQNAHRGDVGSWQEHMLIPQLCQPAWNWMINAMIIAGDDVEDAPAMWSPSPMPMLDPSKEIEGYCKAVRNGFMTWPQVIAELGYDPREQRAEIVGYNVLFDDDDVVFDCDPRHTNGSGQQQQSAGRVGAGAVDTTSTNPDGTAAGDGTANDGSATTH